MPIDPERMPQLWALDESIRMLTGVGVEDIIDASLEKREDEVMLRIHKHVEQESRRRMM